MPDFAHRQARAMPHGHPNLSSLVVAVLLIISVCVGVLTAISQAASWKGHDQRLVALLVPQGDGVRTQVVVANIDPVHGTLALLAYPEDYHVHAGKAGSYSIQALFGLSELNHESLQQLQQQLILGTQLGIDDIVVTQFSRTKPLRVADLLQSFWQVRESTLRFPDRVALWWYVFAHRGSISELSASAKPPSGWQHPAIGAEGYAITVVNSSGQAHLAGSTGALLTALGMNVISVTDTGESMDHGRLVVAARNQLQGATVTLLKTVFGSEPKVEPETAQQYRSAIVIFIGKEQGAILAR